MINIVTRYNTLLSELNEVAHLFPDIDISISVEVKSVGNTIIASAEAGYRRSEFSIETDRQDALAQKRDFKHASKIALYRLLVDLTDYRSRWGSLTGIRPTKLIRDLIQTHGVEKTQGIMLEKYDVERSKLELAIEILRNQTPIINEIDSDDYDVYIGIPFCKTRCLYCSFVSYDYNKSNLIGDYIEALTDEIKKCSGMLCKTPRCIYFGGGTPTAIETLQLEGLIEAALKTFGVPKEFTVEAGRPDTLNEEKLRMLRTMGVNRISINPQSMNKQTLDAIGRSHSPEQVVTEYELARRLGFDNINMDIIIGLPGENLEMLKNTMNEIGKLEPDNLTVHSLAIKRSSKLKECFKHLPLPDNKTADKMMEFAQKSAALSGMKPYYLYRQKYMSGNLENVGYCRPRKECLYNIDIMEEVTSILAFGANAISKFVSGSRIERAPNPKDIATYISNIDKLVANKYKLSQMLE